MNVAEIIQQKVNHLPPQAQREVLTIVEQVESRYQAKSEKQTATAAKHPLTLIVEMAVDVGVADFAERHDFYAHGKLED